MVVVVCCSRISRRHATYPPHAHLDHAHAHAHPHFHSSVHLGAASCRLPPPPARASSTPSTSPRHHAELTRAYTAHTRHTNPPPARHLPLPVSLLHAPSLLALFTCSPLLPSPSSCLSAYKTGRTQSLPPTASLTPHPCPSTVSKTVTTSSVVLCASSTSAQQSPPCTPS
jgi:hypothetical protein